jgi:hypothetical protein
MGGDRLPELGNATTRITGISAPLIRCHRAVHEAFIRAGAPESDAASLDDDSSQQAIQH